MKRKTGKVVAVVFLVLGVLIMATIPALSLVDWVLGLTSGGTMTRSLWLIHSGTDRPSVVLVSDSLEARDGTDTFILHVHGRGVAELTESGAIWLLDPDDPPLMNGTIGDVKGVEVVLLSPFDRLELVSGVWCYNRNDIRETTYLKVHVSDHSAAGDFTWVAVALTSGINTTVVTSSQLGNALKVAIGNTLEILVPRESPITTRGPSDLSDHVESTGGTVIINGTGSEPFFAGQNVSALEINGSDVLESLGLSWSTFEYTPDKLEVHELTNWELLEENIQGQHVLQRNTTSELASALAALPDAPGPLLYCSDADRGLIFDRFNDTTSLYFQSWSNAIRSARTQAMNADIAATSPGVLQTNARLARDLGFHAWLTDNATEAHQARDLLGGIVPFMETYGEPGRQLLDDGYALAYYVLAWDFIQSFLTAEEDEKIEQDIYEYARWIDEGVADLRRRSRDNNWITVSSAGNGLAAMKLRDPALLHHVLDQTEYYLSENIRAEGAIYEGQNYAGYAFTNHQRFLLAMANYEAAGFPNYFKDARYQNFYQFTVRVATPDKFYPAFEDAGIDASGRVNGLIAAGKIAASNPTLARELMWLGEDSVNSTSDSCERLVFIDLDILSAIPSLPAKLLPDGTPITNETAHGYIHPTNTASYMARDSGLYMMRSDWSERADYVAFSAKTYPQSHVHYDELCFEFWADGKQLMGLPGYPGWAREHHDWTKTTEASNGGWVFVNSGGQNHDRCKGATHWLRGRHLDMVEADGDGLYRGNKIDLVHYREYAEIAPLVFAGAGLVAGVAANRVPIIGTNTEGWRPWKGPRTSIPCPYIHHLCSKRDEPHKH